MLSPLRTSYLLKILQFRMPDNKIFRCKTLSFINQTMHTRESWAALWKIKKYQNIETQLFPLNLRKPKIVCYVYKPLCRINFYGSIHLIFRFQKLGGLLFPLLHPIADVMLKFMFYTYDHWREGEADLHLECKSLVWAGVSMISALLRVRNVLFDFYLVNDLWFYEILCCYRQRAFSENVTIRLE